MTLIFSVFATAFLSAQIQNPDTPIPPDPNIRIGKLNNGITYYIKYNKKPEQRVELRLAINAGSICETDGQQGLAHFVEHMCFNGTKNFPSNRIIDMLEEMGMKFGTEVNAYTSFDQTIYMLKVPTDKEEWINRGFQVLEDWAHQVSLEGSEIDKERGVIVEEWRLGLGADDRMMQKYLPVLLKGSRYAERLPIGKVDVIEKFPYDTLRNFYNTWYRPDLMGVVVVGDIDLNLAENKIKEYFGRIPAKVNSKARIEFPVPENTEPLISVVTDREASGFDVQIMFKHPKASSITFTDYRNQLLRMLYTNILDARFNEISQKPDAPFMYAGPGYGSFIGRTVDVYSLSAGAKENQVEKCIDILISENERIRQFGVTAPELEREKRNILMMYEKVSKESDKTESANYADEFVRNYLTQECIPGIIKEFEIVKEYLPGISLEELNKTGHALTTDKNMIVLVTAQEKPGVKVPSAQEVSEIIRIARSKKAEAYVDKLMDVPLLSEMPKSSPVIKRTQNDEFGYTEVVFGNGVRMVLKPTDFKNDEILMTSFSNGGYSLYPDKDVMSAMIATDVISASGLGEYDYTGLQKKLSGNTARITPYINELREGVSGSCSPKDIETMLQLNYLYFTGTRIDEDAYNAYLSRLKNSIKPIRAVPMMIFRDTLSKIISGNSPRVIALPSDAQIEQADLNRIFEIFRDRFADAGDFTYIIVGNFKTDEMLPMLEKYIGGLPSIKRKETWQDRAPEFPEGKIIVDVPKNSEPQSQVAMVWKDDFRWKTNERMGFTILMKILAIKCREAMREDQGGVYGVSINGSVSPLPESTYTITSTWGCKPENIDTLSQTVLNEMRKIVKDGPTENDMKKVKETMIRERETQVRENSFWLSYLQNPYMYGVDLLSLGEYIDFVNAFPAKKVKAIAKRYFDTEEFVRVTLTPMEKTESR